MKDRPWNRWSRGERQERFSAEDQIDGPRKQHEDQCANDRDQQLEEDSDYYGRFCEHCRDRFAGKPPLDGLETNTAEDLHRDEATGCVVEKRAAGQRACVLRQGAGPRVVHQPGDRNAQRDCYDEGPSVMPRCSKQVLASVGVRLGQEIGDDVRYHNAGSGKSSQQQTKVRKGPSPHQLTLLPLLRPVIVSIAPSQSTAAGNSLMLCNSSTAGETVRIQFGGRRANRVGG